VLIRKHAHSNSFPFTVFKTLRSSGRFSPDSSRDDRTDSRYLVGIVIGRSSDVTGVVSFKVRPVCEDVQDTFNTLSRINANTCKRILHLRNIFSSFLVTFVFFVVKESLCFGGLPSTAQHNLVSEFGASYRPRIPVRGRLQPVSR
jgi:hypothetical protein